jgi:thiosulfate dehydrogenase
MTGQADRRGREGLAAVAVLCLLIGAATVAIALRWERPSHGGSTAPAATEEYGRRLLADTSSLLGPDALPASLRSTGSRMRCGACHLGAGTTPGTLSLLQAAANYPKFSGRDGGVRDLQDRINGCLQRSMNGRALPRDSVELLAMARYVESLARQWDAMGAGERAAHEPPPFRMPDRAASLADGGRVFHERCAICHGADGSGLRATAQPVDGYVVPPLWGPDSFNTGAGMHRVLTAAHFIKARMPLGRPDLTDDQAFDVAAYLNAQPRPVMPGLEQDYPDRTTKPVDCPYGPYADPFPQDQHRFGPFAPIRAYYAARMTESH